MVMVLEQTMIDEIVRIGRDRAPAEACGIITPEPIRGRWVWECVNRSESPNDSMVMRGQDVVLLLERLYPDVPHNIIPRLVVWHTHPQGNVGPSAFDLQHKPPKLRCLVVALGKGDEVSLATWY